MPSEYRLTFSFPQEQRKKGIGEKLGKMMLSACNSMRVAVNVLSNSPSLSNSCHLHVAQISVCVLYPRIRNQTTHDRVAFSFEEQWDQKAVQRIIAFTPLPVVCTRSNCLLHVPILLDFRWIVATSCEPHPQHDIRLTGKNR